MTTSFGSVSNLTTPNSALAPTQKQPAVSQDSIDGALQNLDSQIAYLGGIVDVLEARLQGFLRPAEPAGVPGSLQPDESRSSAQNYVVGLQERVVRIGYQIAWIGERFDANRS